MEPIQQLVSAYLQEPATIEQRLMGGMSNQMYTMTYQGNRCTFRVPGKNASMFVDRHIELKNIEVVRPLGINNDTLVFDTSNGYKVALYVEGTPFSQLEDLHLQEVAAVLHELHDSAVRFDNDYDPFGRLAQYESYHQHQTADYEATKARLLQYKDWLSSQPMVAAHNDAQRSNFVLSGKKTYLLDWEFAGNNDPLYDVACFGNISFDHALALLPVYLGKEPSTDEIKRLTLWRTFQALQWHNVAWYKDDIGLSQELQVDFANVAQKYLTLAQSLLSRLT